MAAQDGKLNVGAVEKLLSAKLDEREDALKNLVKGDCDSVKQHQDFYDEYLAVMDLTAEFYLQTVKTVFQDHALPKGTMMHHGVRVDCSAIRDTALLTVEGERDDICSIGQTMAAHDLCSGLSPHHKHHHLQPGVGHYGVFSGRRWESQVYPVVRRMIAARE